MVYQKGIETKDTSYCNQCENLGYLTQRGHRWAKALVCECRMPCHKCDDGWRYERGEDGRQYAMECECRQLHTRIRNFNSAQIPAAYHDKTIQSFKRVTDSQGKVFHWLATFEKTGQPGDKGILIVGNPGTGKTHLLCAILRTAILDSGLNCRYIDSFQLLQQLKASYDAGDKGSSKLMDELSSVAILGLDELGKTRTTGWQREVLDQIISRRYDTGLTTFVTSNYGLEKIKYNEADPNQTRLMELSHRETLEERVGQRIYSRLMEMCKPFQLDGSDHRMNEHR